jgi:hypothetical protein
MTQPTLYGGDFELKPRRGLCTPRVALEVLFAMIINAVASGKRAAHCYSAHVPGQGYVNRGDDPKTREDYLRQLKRSLQSQVDNMGYASGYAEPGYHDPARGILFANWNLFPRGIDKILEYAGYETEWSDEWSVCDCGKAVRTSPDSYSWSPSYAILGDCDFRCHECIVSDDPSDYLEEICGDHDRCVTESLARRIDLGAAGYTRYAPPEGQYESGLHAHMTDNPRKIAAEIKARGIDPSRILFVQTEQSQFYIKWEVWLKNEDDEETEEDTCD